MRAAWLALCLAACSAGQDAPTDAVDTDAAAVDSASPHVDPLASERFAFCHEAGADADQLAIWCELLEEAPADACPGLRKTCADGNFEAQPTGCGGFNGRGEVAPGFAGAPGDESPWRGVAGGCVDPTEGLGLIDAALRWMMAAGVAVLIVVLLRVLWSKLGLGGAQPPRRALAPTAPQVVIDAIDGDDDLGALPEDELLARARRALEAGALGEAVLFARGAALRRLARRGLLTLHKARTDREYVRGVAREPETRDALGSILSAVEDLRWAGRTLTTDRARDAVHAAARILGAALCALLMLWPHVAHAGARRLAPDGDAALYEIMKDVGYKVNTTGGVFEDLNDDVGAMILDLYSVQPASEDWDRIRAWVEDGGLLIVAGNASAQLPELGVWRRFSGLTDSTRRSAIALEVRMSMPRWPGGPNQELCSARPDAVPLVVLPGDAATLPSIPVAVAVVIGGDTDLRATDSDPRTANVGGFLATVDDTDDTGDLDTAAPPSLPLDLRCPEPAQVLAVRRDLGWVIGISDPMILRNAAMIVPANPAFLLELVGADPRVRVPWGVAPGAEMVIASASWMAQPSNPVESMANARMLPFVLHLLLWWALLALWRGWPLAPLREPPAEGRLAFTEHVRALGRQWETRGASRHAASQVAQLALQRHGTAGLAALAHRAGLDPAQIVSTTVDLAEHPDGPDRPDDLEFMEALWTLISTRRT